jgi:hypothetical protein
VASYQGTGEQALPVDPSTVVQVPPTHMSDANVSQRTVASSQGCPAVRRTVYALQVPETQLPSRQ